MYFTYLKTFVSRRDIKIIIFCTVTGAVLQVVSAQYLKRHPELLKDAPVPKKIYKVPRFFSPRGRAVVEVTITGISVKIVAKVILNFLAKKGLLAGLGAAGGIVISKIPATAVSTYLRDSFPQNLSHLEKKRFILVGGEKIYLGVCDQNLEYLFNLLEDEAIPFEEKEKVARSILTNYLGLETMNRRVTFVLCIVFLLYILSVQNRSGFYILLKNLLKAIKEGRISKAVGRAIVRKLKKRGVPIDPELIDAVDY